MAIFTSAIHCGTINLLILFALDTFLIIFSINKIEFLIQDKFCIKSITNQFTFHITIYGIEQKMFISLNYLCTQELKTYSGNGFYIHVISKFSSSLRENEMHSFNTINAQQIFTTVQFTINYIWTTYKTFIFDFFMWDNDIIGRGIVKVFNFNKAPICISNCTFPYYQLFVPKT